MSIQLASLSLIVHFLVLNNLGEKNLFRFTVDENPRGFLCDYAKSLGRALKASVLLTKHYTKYLKGR